MTDAVVSKAGAGDRPPGDQPAYRLRWWHEIAYVVGFYGIYTLVRNLGLGAGSARTAFENARHIIEIERFLGTFHEQTIQALFLPWRTFITVLNIFYGTAHFVVTIGALVWMYRRRPDRYPLWRNTLMATTALALIGFLAFPLAPPRLLGYSYGFVDTLRDIGGLWSFETGAMRKISNQYAAMPSLHFAWSAWSACVLYPMARRWFWKGLAALYPAATLFAIVVTANHYWIDALGGAAVLAGGYAIGRKVTRRRPPKPGARDALEANGTAAVSDPAVSGPAVSGGDRADGAHDDVLVDALERPSDRRPEAHPG